jgi:hypothetical protein
MKEQNLSKRLVEKALNGVAINYIFMPKGSF